MKTVNVVVEDYNPNWVNCFNEIKEELESALKETAVAIEHVGSTAVNGLAAKPIIDIDVVVSDLSDVDIAIRKLVDIGYIYEGNLGIEDRAAFRYEEKEHLCTHHLYVCSRKSKELEKHLKFRDYLRQNPDDAYEYSKIKKEGANLFPKDIEKYIEYKSDFISKIYEKIM